MKRLSSLVLSFSLTCTLVTLLFFTYALPLQTQIETQTPKEAVLERVKNLERIFSLIEKHYLYPDSVDWEKCWSLMVMKLSGGTLYEKRVEREKDSEPKASTCPDKYSRFLTVEETKSDDIEMSGHFSGVGIEISEEKGEVVVKKVFKGPSEGIVKEGDVIIGSRNKEEKTMTPIRDSRDVVKRLRGVSGAIIYITVKRNGTILELPGITRGDIKINSVFSRKLSSNIGYTRINQFGFETADDLEEQVGELRSGGVSRLVLDLRYNPGGVLPAALETLFYFSPDPKTDRMLTVRFRAREVAHTVKCPLPFEVLGKAIICGRFEYPKRRKKNPRAR